MSEDLLQPRSIFAMVMLDQRLATSRFFGRYAGTLGLLADNFYIRDLREAYINPEYYIAIKNKRNPTELDDDEANLFFFGSEAQFSNKGEDVRGLAPEYDGDIFDEGIYLDPGAILLTDDGEVVSSLTKSKQVDARQSLLV